MDFIEKNKGVVVPVAAGVLIGAVLDWVDVPVWMIGGIVAAVAVLGADKLIALYDKEIAPKINKRGGGY